MAAFEAHLNGVGFQLVQPVKPNVRMPFSSGDELPSQYTPQIPVENSRPIVLSPKTSELPSGVVAPSPSSGVAE